MGLLFRFVAGGKLQLTMVMVTHEDFHKKYVDRVI